MVYYVGAWTEAPLTHEIHDAGSGTVGRYADGTVATPLTSGWSIAGWKSYGAGASAFREVAGGISEPPSIVSSVSAAAFLTAYEVPVSDGFGGVAQASISHPRMQLSNDGLGMWTHQERWDIGGSYWKLRYQRPVSQDWDAGVAPPVDQWPDGAIGVGIDFPGGFSQYWITLVEATLIGTDNTDWPLYVKYPGDTTSPWFNDDPALDDLGEPLPGATLLESTTLPVSNTLAIDTAALAAFVQEDVEDGLPGSIDQHDPRWLSAAVVRNGWPGVFGDVDYIGTHGPESFGQVHLSYRGPRWRYVYDRPPVPTYRRNFPRDDALAGGARRNFPPSKAMQSGNRTSGGYI